MVVVVPRWEVMLLGSGGRVSKAGCSAGDGGRGGGVGGIIGAMVMTMLMTMVITMLMTTLVTANLEFERPRDHGCTWNASPPRQRVVTIQNSATYE